MEKGVFFVIIAFCGSGIFAKELTEMKNLAYLSFYKDGDNKYDNRIFPRQVIFYEVGVLVSFQIKHITEFVMETGILSLTGKISMSWYDWNIGTNYIPTEHGSMPEMFLPEDFFWLPPITVYNSVKKYIMISDPTLRARVLYSPFKESAVEWITALKTDIPCVVNVKYFPFDEQECEIVFTSWGYNATEVYMYTEDEILNTAIFEANEEWTLEAGESSNYTIDDNSYLKYKFKLKRKYLWFFISMVAPLVLLSMLTAFVTLMPIDCGERMTFLMTVFLGYAFFMDMVQRTLPRTSNPMPYISYYLTSMLYLSSFAVIINIFLMRIYNKDPESHVPVVVRWIIASLTCRWCCPKKIKPDPDVLQPIKTEVSTPVETIVLRPMERIDWRTTGNVLDILFFYVFTVMHVTCSIVFLVLLSN